MKITTVGNRMAPTAIAGSRRQQDLIELQSCYDPLDRSTAHGGPCHEASNQPVQRCYAPSGAPRSGLGEKIAETDDSHSKNTTFIQFVIQQHPYFPALPNINPWEPPKLHFQAFPDSTVHRSSNSMKTFALFSFVVGLTVSAYYVEPSLANYICPNGPGPGEVQIGMTPGGGNSGVASLPVCEQSSQGQGGQQAPQYHQSPLEGATNALRGELDRKRKLVDSKYEALMRAPFKDLPKNGSWIFVAGKGCEAQFRSRDGMIAIWQYLVAHGQGEAFAKGAALVFIGFGIPTPKTEKRVQVTFEQTGAAPQSVEAVYTPFGAYIGILAIRDAPMTRDGFESMPDKADFRITLDGKQAFAMGWRDAALMRDKLRQCIQLSAR